ncbi:MAG: hypothetical protein ACI9R3_001428 [Verrucomicrobiales bacterium]|jgi:hypothetical protein
MAIHQEWKIRTRARECSHTESEFADGDPLYTALFEDPETGELSRKDFSVSAWNEVRETLTPFSFWKSEFEVPVARETSKNVVEKEGAESLLRRLVEDDEASTENARYILALMLERKKTLKQTDKRKTDTGILLIYEHLTSGEVYIVRDPQLKLSEIASVQDEVSVLLGGKARTDAAAKPPAESAAEVTVIKEGGEAPAEEQSAAS